MYKRQLENDIANIKTKKNQVVKNQNFEEAAKLRDEEKRLLNELEQAKLDWEVKSQSIVHEVTAVSYTHLRAHETVLDLVCRLLLEKKQKEQKKKNKYDTKKKTKNHTTL